MWNFSLILLLDPLINTILLMTRGNNAEQIKRIIFILLFGVVICLATIFIYHLVTNKLQRMINENIRDEAAIRFGKNLPRNVSILFCTPLLSSSIMLSTVSYIIGLIVSPYQVIFYYLKDILLMGGLTFFHYYRLLGGRGEHPASTRSDNDRNAATTGRQPGLRDGRRKRKPDKDDVQYLKDGLPFRGTHDTDETGGVEQCPLPPVRHTGTQPRGAPYGRLPQPPRGPG